MPRKRPEITIETAIAFEELRIIAAKMMGADPDNVTMTICRPSPIESGDPDINSRPSDEEFFYAQHAF